MSIAFPFLGYLILFNDSIVEVLSFNQLTAGSGTFLPGVVRLQFLYFGFIFLAAASAWFHMRAPSPIKTATDKDTHRKNALQDWSVYEIARCYMQLERNYSYGLFDDTQFSREDLYLFLNRATNTSGIFDDYEIEDIWFEMPNINNSAEAKSQSREFLGELLDAHYDFSQYSQRHEAKILTVLTTLSYLCISVPSLDVFLAVTAGIFSLG